MLINRVINGRRIIIVLVVLFFTVDSIVVVATSFFLKFHLGIIFLLSLLTLFSVVIPGIFMQEVLQVKCKSYITKLSLSFFWGFTLLIIAYFVSVILNLEIIIWLYVFTVNLFSLFFYIKRYRFFQSGNSLSLCKRIDELNLLLFLVFLFVCILFKCFASEPINGLGCINVFPDYVWHMGIINTLSEGFPPTVPWSNSGMTIKYHYFNDLFYAILKRMTNVSSDVLVVQFSSYINAFLTSFCGYAFLVEFKVQKKKAFYLILLMVFLCASQTNFFIHFFSNVNSVGVSICCIMMLLVVMSYFVNSNKENGYGYLLTYIMLLFLLVGLKAPFALVFVAAITVTTFLIFLFKKNDVKQAAILLSSSIVTFSVCYYVFIKKQSSGGARSFSISFGDTLSYFDLYKNIINEKNVSISVVIFMMLLYIALFIGVCLIPAIFNIGGSFKVLFDKNANCSILLLFSSIMICISIISLSVLSFDSNNQIYFGFACMPALILCMGLFSDMCNNKYLKRANIIIGSVLFIAGIIFVSRMFYLDVFLVNKNSYIESTLNDLAYINRSSVFTNYEYDGMIWLKKHTKKNDLIAGDRYSLDSMDSYDINNRFCSRWFYYTAYSERTFFLEGSGYGGVESPEQRVEFYRINESLYNNKGNRKDIAKKMGVKYIVLSKRISKVKSIAERGIKKCFNNKDISIYKVL